MTEGGTMKRGDILKFTPEGLAALGPSTMGGKETLKKMRFEYRCESRGARNCISVVRVGSTSYRTFDKSFLKLA